jgi:hypothetical protein
MWPAPDTTNSVGHYRGSQAKFNHLGSPPVIHPCLDAKFNSCKMCSQFFTYHVALAPMVNLFSC